MATEREKNEIKEEIRNFQQYIERKARIENTCSKEDLIRGLKLFCKEATYTTEDIQDFINEIIKQYNISGNYLNAAMKHLLITIDTISVYVNNIEKCH